MAHARSLTIADVRFTVPHVCRILDAVYPEYVLHLSADEFEDAWYAHDLEIAALGPLLYQG